MPNFDGNIIIGTSVDVGGINSGLNKISNAFRKLSPGNSLTRFFQDAAGAASDLVEVQNIVDVTFEDLAWKAEKFGNIAIKNFGMSRLSAKYTAGTFMAMGRAMDLDQEAASNMAIQLSALTGDFASFYNISQEYAKTALSAVYTGETETLKRYGIILTEANLQQYALSQGIDASVKKMSARDKLILRYMYVMEHTKDMQGDFVRTQGTWANQTRQLEQNWQEFMIVLGNGITTVLSPLLVIINNIIFAMTRFAKLILIIIGNIYGLSFGDLTESMGGYSDATEDAVEAEEDLEDAVTGAGKAAMKALQPFDELNVLRSTKSGGSGGTTDLFADFEIPDPTADWFDDVEEKLSSLIDNMYDFGRFLANTFQDLLEKIPWEKVFEVARKVGKDVSDFLNGIFSPSLFATLGKTFANGLNTIIYAVQEFAHNLDWAQIGESFSEWINNFFKTFDFDAFADTINTLVEGFWMLVGTFIENTDWKLIKEKIGGFLGKIDWTVWQTLIGAGLFALLTSKAVRTGLLNGISTLFNTVFTVANITAVFSKISSFFKGYGLLKLLGFTVEPVEDVFLQAGALEGPIADTVFTPNPAVLKFWETLSGIFAKFGSWFVQANTLDLAAIFTEGSAAEIGFTIGTGLIEGIIAAVAGFEFGKWILGPLLSPDDADLYKDFKLFGKDGFFGTLFDTDFKTILTAIHDMLTDLNGIGLIISPLIGSVLRLIDAIKEGDVLGAIAAGIDTILNVLIPPLGGAIMLVEELINTIIKWFGGEGIADFKFGLLDTIIEKLTEAKDFVIEKFEEIKAIVGPKIEEIVSNIKTKLEPIITVITNIYNFISQILYGGWILVKYIFMLIGEFIEAKINLVWAVIQNLVTKVKGVFTVVYHYIANIVSTIAGIIANVAEIVWTKVSGVVIAIWDKIVEIYGTISDWIFNNITEPVLNALVSVWEKAVEVFTNIYNKFSEKVRAMIEYFKTTWVEPIKQKATEVLEWIKTKMLDPLKTAFDTVVTEIKGFFTSLWEDIKEGVKGMANSVIGMFEKLINGVISNGLNKFISFFNDVVGKASEKTGDSWSPISDISLINIPRLAKGAVIPPNSPFLAMLGDQKNGTNIEAPLDTIKQALQEALASSGFGSNNDIIIPLTIDGREIARAVVKQNEIFKKSSGRSLI